MLESIFKQTLLVLICLQGFVLCWQLLNALLRIQERSKWNFLALIGTFLLFNVVNLVHLQIPGIVNAAMLDLLTGGSGLVLAAVLMIYILREYCVPKPKIQSVKYIYLIFIGAGIIGFAIVCLLKGHVQLVKNLFIPLPIVLSVIYCISVELSLKHNKVVLERSGARLMIYAGYTGVVLMNAGPAGIYFQVRGELSILISNLIFLLVLTIYVRQLYIDAQLANQRREEADLARYGLSNRELEVAVLLLEGMEYPAIAKLFGRSETSVRTQAWNLFRKTGASGKVEFRKKFGKN